MLDNNHMTYVDYESAKYWIQDQPQMKKYS